MSKDSRIDIDEELYNFLSEFGKAVQKHKFEKAIQPSLAVVVSPKNPSINKDSLEEKLRLLPSFAFKVSFITGTEYCPNAGTNMNKKNIQMKMDGIYLTAKDYAHTNMKTKRYT